MREFVIHNVDFIQIPVNPGDDKVYFPVSSHLEGKKILSIEYFSDEKGLDITGNFHLVKLDSSFVTLYDKEGNLVISKESNAGSPLTVGHTPLLTFDVWEHAYYIDYRNRRAEQLHNLWKIVDWSVVEARYNI